MLYIGADHRGIELKEKIKKFLDTVDIQYKDLGSFDKNTEDDYPDIAADVARYVLLDRDNKGIVICGTGVGVDIVCNKHPGIRCALCFNKEVAKLSREHEAINVCSLPADYISFDEATATVMAFLRTDFSFLEKHSRRLGKIVRIEEGKLP